ncbi:MAG: type II toxin-antitoxin system HicB family antitoxin [Anaerolineae bacterium]
MDKRARAEELAKRPYLIATSLEETTDGEPIYVARVLEMEGCFGQGKTREAAIEDLRLAMVDFIESLLEDGLPVPEPTPLVTLKTTAQGTFTFVQQGKTLQPQFTEIYRDVYILPAHAG